MDAGRQFVETWAQSAVLDKLNIFHVNLLNSIRQCNGRITCFHVHCGEIFDMCDSVGA